MDLLFDYLFQINWFAVVVAACLGMLVNAVWYSEALFSKVWLKSAGLKKKDTNNPGVELGLVISLILLLITSAAMAVLMDALKITGGWAGLLFGILVAGGFTLTNNGINKINEQRPFALFAITAVGDILTLAVIGVILSL